MDLLGMLLRRVTMLRWITRLRLTGVSWIPGLRLLTRLSWVTLLRLITRLGLVVRLGLTWVIRMRLGRWLLCIGWRV